MTAKLYGCSNTFFITAWIDFYAMMPDAMHILHESKYPACLQLQTEAAGAIVWEYFGRLWSASMFFILFSVKEISNPQALS